MKLDEFLKSPVGKGAIMPGKDIIVGNLNYRLQILLKNKEIKVNIYTDKDFAYYHFLIPTESDDKENEYDVNFVAITGINPPKIAWLKLIGIAIAKHLISFGNNDIENAPDTP